MGGGSGGGMLNGQSMQEWRKLFVDIVPKLTVRVKPVTYIIGEYFRWLATYVA